MASGSTSAGASPPASDVGAEPAVVASVAPVAPGVAVAAVVAAGRLRGGVIVVVATARGDEQDGCRDRERGPADG